jgi:lipopolysaccharide transport system ATP-binding protein
MKPIVEVKGLWKEYQRGAQKEKYLSLRDNLFKSFKPSAKKESFWALQDINFEVYPGDSLAIIGKNGAGKSTLLKILSKITPPTKGEITLRGRLASLLEVGTGFHPELTGRENIYLNGSILGLGRSEINRQFDAIVDFSGVEAFLDTPLKHYSSGMQLRLAFAVAAHLEPEVLVIDEVLAVGDSAFQQKCIDKMTEVSASGRTILFVSHNMQAIRNLCQRGVLLVNGKEEFQGNVEASIQHYLKGKKKPTESETIDCGPLLRRDAQRELEFSELSANTWSLMPGEELRLSMKLINRKEIVFSDLLFGVNILDANEQCVIHLSNVFKNQLVLEHKEASQYDWTLPQMSLKPGIYTVSIFLRANEEIQDWIRDAAVLEILQGNVYGFSNSEMIQGIVQPEFEFEVNENR